MCPVTQKGNHGTKTLRICLLPGCGLTIVKDASEHLEVRHAPQASLEETHDVIGLLKCNRCKTQVQMHYKKGTS